LDSPRLKLQFEFILYAIVVFRVNILFMLIEFEQEIKKKTTITRVSLVQKIPFKTTTKTKKLRI